MSSTSRFMRAAKIVETPHPWHGQEHLYACDALNLVYATRQQRKLFETLIAPENTSSFVPWFGRIDKPANATRRVVALLFMHWIWIDRGRHNGKRGRGRQYKRRTRAR